MIFTSLAFFVAPGVLRNTVAFPPFFLYFSPETILPVASLLASILGAGLLFGRYVLALFRKALRRSAPVTAEGPTEAEELDLNLDDLPEAGSGQANDRA